MIGQVTPRLGLAVTDPLDEEPDSRLGITLVDKLDGNVGNAHSTTLAYAQQHTLVPRGACPTPMGRALLGPRAG